MRRNVHQSILQLAENYSNNEAKSHIEKAMEINNEESICLTIKNYAMCDGLSRYMHADGAAKDS